MTFDENQIERYARHLILDEIGGKGQNKLLNSKVLVVGAGGLGSPILLYLAAAGVGTLGIIDDDRVALSNLQRQIIHDENSISDYKTKSAVGRIEKLNPDVKLIPYTIRLTAKNIEEIFNDYDIIADGSDNFDTRFLINDACYLMKKILVSGAILRFDGQLSTFKAFQGTSNPCYRCIHPEPPPPNIIPSCAEGGVLGAIAGTIGSLQAVEIIKELLEIGNGLSGRLLIYDALSTMFRAVKVKPDPSCKLCSKNSVIKNLSLHI
ncbi:MAG: adenylyltransferase [Rhodospirillaceae bacterium]|nr:adenylyltransferase [Alphaproteobacteria bacterium]MBR72895.1 adenylyltransferase [Rhodospirillaceae bacterium]|tara:strand:- start:1069 stop:1860 length:792 start_codon:yes stop_codon:yes gene_type:complete